MIFHYNYPLIVNLKVGLVVMKEENEESERARQNWANDKTLHIIMRRNRAWILSKIWKAKANLLETLVIVLVLIELWEKWKEKNKNKIST